MFPAVQLLQIFLTFFNKMRYALLLLCKTCLLFTAVSYHGSRTPYHSTFKPTAIFLFYTLLQNIYLAFSSGEKKVWVILDRSLIEWVVYQLEGQWFEPWVIYLSTKASSDKILNPDLPLKHQPQHDCVCVRKCLGVDKRGVCVCVCAFGWMLRKPLCMLNCVERLYESTSPFTRVE